MTLYDVLWRFTTFYDALCQVNKVTEIVKIFRKVSQDVAKFGHPQTCVYPDVCLGIAHVSGKAPPWDKESGRYTMYLPFSPHRICRAKRADTLCIYPTPSPEGGTLPDTWAIPKHTSG